MTPSLRRRLRRPRPPELEVAPGERLLAWAVAVPEGGADSGRPAPAVVGGTRDALYVRPAGAAAPVRIAWEDVEAADWDAESGRLRVSEVGTWGAPRPVHEVPLVDPERLLQLVRERVTASVVLQRHVRLVGRRGVRVIARRAPRGGPLRWLYEYDEGVDPDDPEVRRRAEAALAVALAEAGETWRAGGQGTPST